MGREVFEAADVITMHVSAHTYPKLYLEDKSRSTWLESGIDLDIGSLLL